MLPILVLGVVSFTVVYFTLSTWYKNRHHTKRAEQLGCKPPKRRQHHWPLGIDLLRQLIDADQKERVPQFLLETQQELKVGTWVQNLMGEDMIATMEPKNIQALLATQFSDFELGQQRRGSFNPIFGHGIFTNDGKAWEHSRAMLRPQFARDQVADLEAEEHHFQDLTQHLPVDSSGWTNTVDLSPLFFRLTLDSATEFLFGESVKSQLAALPSCQQSEKTGLDWSSFGPAFDTGTMEVAQRFRLGGLYWARNTKAYKDSIKTVHGFADYYVQLALSNDLGTLEKRGDEKKQKYIFLQELVKATRDPVELRSQLLNILLAGRDTTAGLLGWTYYLLARNHNIYDKLRKEVLDTFGSYDKPRDITFSSLKACSYLQWVMSESLRLYPTVPFNSRRAVRDTTLPVGGGPDQKSPVYVRKGSEVNYAVHITHHSPEIWGADVEEFKPERWQNRKTGWEFLPFNGGPRICLGQQHALTLAGFTLVRLMQKFDKIEKVDSDPYTKHHYGLTTAPSHCSVRLHAASKD
jgi:cytochrome P450